ncbi:MAG: DUF1501 domain-containing protein [Planctomycetaceae bacterium]
MHRRELLQVGSLGLAGLGSDLLTGLQRTVRGAEAPRAKSCVFLFLFGGPSQIDLWDQKPKAPVEIRGDFTPVQTKVPGMHLCEHLPRLAQQADKLCLLRSMTHRMNVHGPACSEVFTGRDYQGPPVTDQATPEDWPSLASLTTRYAPSPLGLPPAIVLPWYLQFPGQSKRIAGQTGGRMGERFNPLLVQGGLDADSFAASGLQGQTDAPWGRVSGRRGLLEQLERVAGPQSVRAIEEFRLSSASVYSLLEHQTAKRLDLGEEPEALRTRYGSTPVGRSLLAARRLVEAGVPLVTVNWHDETVIDGANTCWDTHQDNFQKLKTLLCPMLDQAFPTFLEDLHDRGLLETTLVVAVGEFGRTPKLGQFTQSSNTRPTGRDHWPHAFTALVAGGGVRGGQVYGATNATAGYVVDKPVSPADLTATILSHLGVDLRKEYDDEFQRIRRRLSEGRVISDWS